MVPDKGVGEVLTPGMAYRMAQQFLNHDNGALEAMAKAQNREQHALNGNIFFMGPEGVPREDMMEASARHLWHEPTLFSNSAPDHRTQLSLIEKHVLNHVLIRDSSKGINIRSQPSIRTLYHSRLLEGVAGAIPAGQIPDRRARGLPEMLPYGTLARREEREMRMRGQAERREARRVAAELAAEGREDWNDDNREYEDSEEEHEEEEIPRDPALYTAVPAVVRANVVGLLEGAVRTA